MVVSRTFRWEAHSTITIGEGITTPSLQVPIHQRSVIKNEHSFQRDMPPIECSHYSHIAPDCTRCEENPYLNSSEFTRTVGSTIFKNASRFMGKPTKRCTLSCFSRDTYPAIDENIIVIWMGCTWTGGSRGGKLNKIELSYIWFH